MREIKIEQFEGPLDVLLQLIEDNKLEITEVSLAEITEQYIALLQKAANTITATDLADFLVVAARLMLIKSRALLPFLEWEEDEEDGKDLARQLKIYKQYLDASKHITELYNSNRTSFSRERLRVTREVEFSPPPSVTSGVLGEVFAKVLQSLDPVVATQAEVIRKTINIQEKIEHIRTYITQKAKGQFSDIVKNAKDRGEVIVSFLALLELMKQRIVVVRQDTNFEDISIESLK